jgi:hypothetical protein
MNMKKKLVFLLSVFLMVALLSTPVSAGPGIGLKSVTFSLGSLIANGTLIGVGNTNVTVIIDGSGIPVITCTNSGANPVPGQSYPKVSASGKQDLDGGDPFRKNGKILFGVETVDPETLSWDVAGCPNANWTGHIDFIFWTDAKISVLDTATQALLLQQDFACTTTLTSVSCTPK